MTTFENELMKIFDNIDGLTGQKYIGRAFYASLDNDIKFKAEFISTNSYEHYDALRFRVLRRDEGEIDANTIRLKDVWGMKPVANGNFPNGVSPHMWIDRGNLEWYAYRPNNSDYEKLRQQLADYIDVFRDMSLQYERKPSLDEQITNSEAKKVTADSISEALERGEFR